MATPLKMGFLGDCQMVWVSEKSVVGAETGVVSTRKRLNSMGIILQGTILYL
jgi:hypothetical protein